MSGVFLCQKPDLVYIHDIVNIRGQCRSWRSLRSFDLQRYLLRRKSKSRDRSLRQLLQGLCSSVKLWVYAVNVGAGEACDLVDLQRYLLQRKSGSKDRSLRQLLQGIVFIREVVGIRGQRRSWRSLRSFDLQRYLLRRKSGSKDRSLRQLLQEVCSSVKWWIYAVNVGAGEACDLLILIFSGICFSENQGQEIAACGSSYEVLRGA
jgi:hypothetical protein